MTQPTLFELKLIERSHQKFEEKLAKNPGRKFIEEPSSYGRELIEDTEMLLSIIPHQKFIEEAFRDFHSKIAEQILNMNDK